jgi:hypothetical protein
VPIATAATVAAPRVEAELLEARIARVINDECWIYIIRKGQNLCGKVGLPLENFCK